MLFAEPETTAQEELGTDPQALSFHPTWGKGCEELAWLTLPVSIPEGCNEAEWGWEVQLLINTLDFLEATDENILLQFNI